MNEFSRLQEKLLSYLEEQFDVEAIDDESLDKIMLVLFKAYEYGADSVRLQHEESKYVH